MWNIISYNIFTQGVVDMVKKQNFNKRFTYLLIAILCLANLFLGAKVINKLANTKRATEINDENMNDDKVIEVFSTNSVVEVKEKNVDERLADIKESSIAINDNKVNPINDNIFLKILLNSNAYMKLVYEIENEESATKSSDNNFLENFSSLFKLDFYVKPHLPAIVSAFSDTYSWEEDISEEEKNDDLEGYLILSDIVFIEDPEERNNNEQDLELIGTKHQDKYYIEPPETVSLDHENPYVFLYHTHGTEAYLPITTGRFHTEKREYNVITIGEIIGKVLEEKGHKLKHVDIYHDIPSYNESYIRSLSTLKEELEENENIKVVFDIHRDGIEGDSVAVSKAQDAARITIGGKDVATFSLVIGPDNPNKEKLIKFANYIRHVSESMYPGLFKSIIIKPSGRFNQYVSDYYALIEVGSNLNTIDEAKESAKYIGEILHKVIEGIDNQD